MNIFITGIKRSGTTILFDCLYEDKRFDCYYEPLCHGKINVGGGSGAREVAYGEKLNKARNEFIAQQGLDVSPEFFNLGAPADYKQEIETKMPALHKNYLEFLASKSNITLMKFVRVSHKLRALKEMFPDAKVIHIVRDPRRMFMSHFFGSSWKKSKGIKKLQKFAKQMLKRRMFFLRKKSFDTWRSEHLINLIIKSDPDYGSFRHSPAYEKMMLLWKILNETTRRDGEKYFGADYLQIQHEDLCNNPVPVLENIYKFLGRSCPEEVKQWACAHVKPPKPVYRKKDERWFKTAEKLDIDLNS